MNNQVIRAHNFNAGPSALPLPVLQKAQEELVNYGGTGMSVMELSHRDKVYEDIHNNAIALLRELLGIPSDYEVLFIQGGGSLQFAMVPFNFLPADRQAGYILTGSWSEKALKEAKMLGQAYEAGSTKDSKYSRIPAPSELKFLPNSAYIHITTNNTIYGTQWQDIPDAGEIPLIADMSSDILSKPCDIGKFSLIYAGSQKNLGPAGVTIVIIKRALLDQARNDIPTMLRYTTHAKDNSLYNTPPCYTIYMLGLVLQWVKDQGGVAAIYENNKKKAALLYDAIDQSNGFYRGHAASDSRSMMNVTFRLADEGLEKQFLQEAKAAGFVGVNGHRSVGGCRASLYNAVTYEDCQTLRDFMASFLKKNA